MGGTMSTAQSGYYITQVNITPDTRESLLSKATDWAEDLGSLHGSIENGGGNVAGRYGELVFTEVFGGTIADHYEYDIAYNGLSIDVKTKRRSVTAKPHYEASITDHNPDQDADLYYFMSVRCGDVATPYRDVDLLGYIEPEGYHTAATFHREGERDPDNGFTFSADCWNLPYDKLQRDTGLDETVEI
jgi:hypothetical protein